VPSFPDLVRPVRTTGWLRPTVAAEVPFPSIGADLLALSAAQLSSRPVLACRGSADISAAASNSAGVPGLVTTAPTGSNGGCALRLILCSGANDAGAANIPGQAHPSPTIPSFRRPVIVRLSGDRSAVFAARSCLFGAAFLGRPGYDRLLP